MSLGKAKLCKYNCKTVLAWDDEESYFVEVENNNAQHTRERCESLRAAVGPVAASTPKTHAVVKEAVNQDLMMAVLQEMRKQTSLLQKIAGVEE